MNQSFQPDPSKGVAVAIVISIETGEFLTVKDVTHPNPMERLAGGTIESGESITEALLRELEEEIGIPKGELEIFQNPRGDKRQFPVRVLARNKSHYFHGFVVLATNFKKIHRKPKQDGKSLLEVNIHKSARAVLRKPMVQQHRALLVTMLDMVQ